MRTSRTVAQIGLLLVCGLVFQPAAEAKVVYVSTAGNDTNDGLSWPSAKRTVQAGLNATVAGDEVWVAAGTYFERVKMTVRVALYGGFAGSETDVDQRDWKTNQTILDGDAGGSVITSPPGVQPETRIDGFTIRNGRATNGGGICCVSSSPTIANNVITGNIAISKGGGICCDSGVVTIINNMITDNSGSTGGGVYCRGVSQIVNCTISGNGASAGGGVYCFSAAIDNTIIAFNSSGICTDASVGTPSLRYNCVYGNGANNYSGLTDPTGTDGNICADPKFANRPFGCMHLQPDSPCIDAGDDNEIESDWTDVDGQARIQGGHVDIGADESDGTLWPAHSYVVVRVSPNGDDANDGSSWAGAKRTVQAGINLANALGGEVWVQAGIYQERLTLHPYAYVYGGFAGTETSRDQRDWRTNTTTLDGQGAGSVVTVQAGERVSTIDGFTIQNGKASTGGGIYCAVSSPTIANNTITGNNATSYGGGIYCGGGGPTIVNDTITGNGAPSGGGLYCRGAPTIVNCTITENGSSSGGGIDCEKSSVTIINTIVAFNSAGIRAGTTTTLALRYNCVYGNGAYNYSGLTDPSGTDGNISIDPNLANRPFGGTRLQPDSPCIDAGDDSAIETGWTDIDGQARIQGGHVDIGADESDGTVWPSHQYVVVRVSPNGNDANDGTSWAAAKRTVQAGINLANALGGEVWVQAGTYQERVTLHPYAYLYGGFAGTETSRDQRDWRTHTTILDGQGAGSVVTIQVGEKVSTINGFTIQNGKASTGGGIYCPFSSPTIANNTITGNNATSNGGGISCGSTSLIVNSTITGNGASSGGGIYCSGAPSIVNSTIAGNYATYGGGIACYGSSATITNTLIAFNSSGIDKAASAGIPVLRHNCVYGNTAYNYSGLTDPTGADGNISDDPKLADLKYANVHIQPGSPCRDAGDDAQVQTDWRDVDGQARIQDSHVDIGADESDSALWPVGPYVVVRVSPNGDDAGDGASWDTARRTVQAGINLASSLGGEVWVQAGTYQERITLRSFAHVYGGFAGTETSRDHRDWRTHTTILDGQAAGSVVTVETGERVTTIDGFTIRNGKALSGGGVYCLASSIVTHNTITGNIASRSGGGGIWSASSSIIANNTITGNVAFGGGAGIYCLEGRPTVVNNTITGNDASQGGAVYCGVRSAPTIINTIIAFNRTGIFNPANVAVVLRHNCVYSNLSYNYSGLTDPTGTDGNLSADPKLVVAATGESHIQPDSPCRDAGEDAQIQTDWQDLDGQPRIQGMHVDIGADESDDTVWPPSPGTVVRVSANGNDANDGSSWTAAKRKVQAGVDQASMLGGEVWVQAGTYPERITLHPRAFVYGGFAGTENSRDQRDWRTNATILDGQARGSVVTVQASEGNSAIDGFVIRNGGGTYGGGIYCLNSSPIIANNSITGNTAAADQCGYIDAGGGIYCDNSSPTIANNLITRNLALTNHSRGGGGIYCRNNSSPMIVNNTITANAAHGPYICGGVYCDHSSPTIVNTIIAFNSSGVCSESGTPVLKSNCVYGNSDYGYSGLADPTGTDGNISADPGFVRAPTATDGQWGTVAKLGDPHLKPGSPCIDAGDNAALPDSVLTDLDGHFRLFDDPAMPDTGVGTQPIVDMGAYEFIPGDLDRDGDIDLGDMTVFAACISGPAVPYKGDCGAADFDSDRDIDQSDFGFLQRYYGGPSVFADPDRVR